MAVGDFYCGRMSEVCRDLASRRVLPNPKVSHTFIPRETFAECLRRWTFEDLYSIETVEKISLLAEQAMGGFITLAARKHPFHHLTFPRMVEVLGSSPTLEELLAACPTYDLEAAAAKIERVDYQPTGGLAILTVPEVRFPVYFDILARNLAVMVGREITRESLEFFWTSEFNFECPMTNGTLRVRVTISQVVWQAPTLTITSPNNENFKRCMAQLACQASRP